MLTQAQLDQRRNAAKRRGLQLKGNSAHQRMARQCVKRESCSANGKLGYQATVAKFGKAYALDKLAAKRRAKPSGLEQVVMGWLAEFGVSWVHDERLGESLYYPDFRIETHRLVVEVDGEVWHTHSVFCGKADLERRARKEQYCLQSGYAVVVLCEQDIQSGQARDTLRRALSIG
jgi:G:T-mismatch repair DNA endonuclease (very short patch repair protein)